MSISASEIEKLIQGGDSDMKRPKYTEEYRVEAVGYYKKGHEESGKTIKQCAAELGINPKTLNDWIIKYDAKGKVSQARTAEEEATAKMAKRLKELEEENAFLKKVAAFFAKSVA